MWAGIYILGYVLYYVFLIIELSNRDDMHSVADTILAMFISAFWPVWVAFALLVLIVSPLRRL